MEISGNVIVTIMEMSYAITTHDSQHKVVRLRIDESIDTAEAFSMSRSILVRYMILKYTKCNILRRFLFLTDQQSASYLVSQVRMYDRRMPRSVCLCATSLIDC